MPTDPNTGVVRSGQYPTKPTLEESESGNSVWVTTDDDDDPVLIVSMLNCMSVLVAQQQHIEAIEKAEREGMANLESMRREGGDDPTGAMGVGDEPEYTP